ncbi:MAG: DUF5060 domain-containing protein [Phycisphaerae bacterium]
MPCVRPSALTAAVIAAAVLTAPAPAAPGEPLAKGRVFSVVDLAFEGPTCGPKDAPARDVTLAATFRHASGDPAVTVHGFWDGDGRGGGRGNVFKVRFCPTKAGRWTLEAVESSAASLDGQREGAVVDAVPTDHPGFWMPDPETPDGRWYRRSDGSHPYLFGNTHYTFLSRMTRRGPCRDDRDIAADVRANAACFKKLRFGVHGGRYTNPDAKPYVDDAGRPTDDGDFSHRPSPAWFHQRVDAAVAAAYEVDLVADIILSGPDTREARSALRAGASGGDPTPYLRYMAARYGSYPNVWFCLENEWDIKNPKYSAKEVKRAGRILRKHLPYPTPVSIHGRPADWDRALNADPPWHDHVILQGKIKRLAKSADFIARNVARGGGVPVVNDELGYQGRGDKFSRDDVIEGHLGAFLGGGYGTTGHKPASKCGHYFWGGFTPDEHTAARHLGWLREIIDARIAFWTMRPVPRAETGFKGLPDSARAMVSRDGREIVLGTREATKEIVAALPPGRWHIVRYDVVAMEETVLAEGADGRFTFAAPDSRAVLFHFKRAGGK